MPGRRSIASRATALLPSPGGLYRDKATVMEAIRCLVAAGQAELKPLEGGDLHLRLGTGEVFRLGQDLVTRVA